MKFPRQKVALGGPRVTEGAVLQIRGPDLGRLMVHGHVIGLVLRSEGLNRSFRIGRNLGDDIDILRRVPNQSGRQSRSATPIRQTAEVALQRGLMASKAFPRPTRAVIEAPDRSCRALAAMATHASRE